MLSMEMEMEMHCPEFAMTVTQLEISVDAFASLLQQTPTSVQCAGTTEF